MKYCIGQTKSWNFACAYSFFLSTLSTYPLSNALGYVSTEGITSVKVVQAQMYANTPVSSKQKILSLLKSSHHLLH